MDSRTPTHWRSFILPKKQRPFITYWHLVNGSDWKRIKHYTITTVTLDETIDRTCHDTLRYGMLCDPCHTPLDELLDLAVALLPEERQCKARQRYHRVLTDSR